MADPIIMTVDDDPAVSQAITRDLRARYGDRYRVAPRVVGRRGVECARGGGPPGSARGADRVGPPDARDDGHRVARPVGGLRARGQARAAHGVRRHRRGDPRDQRDRARPLPDEAVGAARGAPVPGARRPARASGTPSTPIASTAFGSSATAGRNAATTPACSWPATTCRTSGWSSNANPKRARLLALFGGDRRRTAARAAPRRRAAARCRAARDRRRARTARRAPSRSCTTSS